MYRINGAITDVQAAINSGALVQVTLRGHTLGASAVEASAASHVSPAYPRSAEAPRIYGERINAREERLEALEWLLDVLTPDRRPTYDETERELRAGLQAACAQLQ